MSAHLAEWVGHCLLPQRIARPRAAPDWSSASLQPLLKTLEAALSSRRFLTGPELTIADFSVAGMTTYFGSAGFPLDDFPALSRWYSDMDELDSWRATASPPWTTNPRPAT
ncbi:MAG TPA: glutathione S-transferase C-terminal domain-containing protein [Steroidobacteraceae bacterium]